MAIIIIQNDENEFLIDRVGTAIFLASLISLYPILQNVDANKKRLSAFRMGSRSLFKTSSSSSK